MNQQCKVCGEPAAGFHFGAFTCEGCKSFFGRSYNNLSSISECKNGGECVINKKNRTACKACRLRKCLLVGMSKSGSRYGRRSNWFKIHCLLQEQQQRQQQQHHQQHHQQQHPHQQQQQQQQQQHHRNQGTHQRHPMQHQQLQHQQTNSTSPSMSIHGVQQRSPKDDVIMLGLEDYKNSTSPSISSPESHNSDSSVEVSERRAAYGLHPGFRPLHPAQLHPHAELSALSKEMMSLPMGFHLSGMPLIPSAFLPPPGLTMFSPYHLYSTHHNPTHLLPNHTSPTVKTSPIGSSNSTTVGSNNNADLAEIFHNNNNNNHHNNISSNSGNNNNNNNRQTRNHNVRNDDGSMNSPDQEPTESCNKRFYLDAVLKSQRTPTLRSPASCKTRSDVDSPRNSPDRDVDSLPTQDNPIDLSMKSNFGFNSDESENDEDIDMDDHESDRDSPPLKRRPMDLTIRT